MRKFLMAAMMFGAVQSAQAADMPDLPFLRGSFTDAPIRGIPNWQGYYVGGQAAQGWLRTKPPAGYNADIEAAYTLRTGLAPSLIAVPPMAEGRKVAFGGFVGYNSQWDDIIVGVEANYLHSSIAASSIAYPPISDPVRAQSSVNVALTDLCSLLLRAGYMVGNFLPYTYVGFGAGSADVTRSAGVTSNAGVPVTLPFEMTQKNLFIYGYSAGLGVDVLLVGGLFARAEYEYTQFTTKVNTSINTVRVGLGYKF